MNIVFLSHTPRNYLFKVGSYHLSRNLASMGHRVLYVPSPLSLFHFLNLPKLGDADYRNVLKSRLNTLSPNIDSDNITNLTPFVLTPFNRGIFDRARIPLNQWFTFNRMGSKIKKLDFKEADLVIQDKPGLFFMRKFIQARTWIYRATDDYSNMSRGAGKQAIQDLEQQICTFADLVLVTSEPLRQLFEQRYGIQARVLRNGVEASHFSTPREKPREYLGITTPIVLYVGSLDDRFDLDLLKKTARLSPDLHFVIIGPGSRKHLDGKISNITALGPKPYEEVPAFMQHADIGILPLKLTEANHARSPMKVYEYGISGLPVVSTPLKELKNRNEDFITFAGDAKQFHEQLRYCLNNQQKLAAMAQQESRKHSWQSITKQLLNLATPKSPDHS
ncbi:glycosyltransferase [Fodinibius sediminis]|uniref:Glycosyl transferases group 1 n=1 Tax=Fodinibius sediminis TaxID=1214077 RepID=A0A521F362_9BACT|nr:glycosyltransferase [Fodinibius sediminis]SMO90589.1 Glycosyl transferases group 1 [Fodinibius sediminis]